ncbi:hypothetical protein F4780DRAFT_782078 [Xylariomycetidae sp. FL0641]|nr:hypothetical protein F4780DRAFT_782078 [Xylariomycetidae sp. FL0641]
MLLSIMRNGRGRTLRPKTLSISYGQADKASVQILKSIADPMRVVTTTGTTSNLLTAPNARTPTVIRPDIANPPIAIVVMVAIAIAIMVAIAIAVMVATAIAIMVATAIAIMGATAIAIMGAIMLAMDSRRKNEARKVAVAGELASTPLPPDYLISAFTAYCSGLAKF